MYKCAFWNQFKQLFSTCWLWLLSMVKQLYIFQIANMYFLMGVFILKVAWQEISPRQTTWQHVPNCSTMMAQTWRVFLGYLNTDILLIHNQTVY